MNTAIHITYLGVALASLTTYLIALRDLRERPPLEHLAYRGLMRTALSRVAVGIMYSIIGVLVVFWSGTPIWLTLLGFILAACAWITNSRLDVHLKRRLDTDTKGTP